MLSLVVYIPDSHVEEVKAAMLDAGAGRVGNYDHCCWQTIGQGQFRPLKGADPAVGTIGKLEVVDEWKVEMVVDPSRIDAVLKAMKNAHPYETAAYHFTEVKT
jgi:hypothetical protein